MLVPMLGSIIRNAAAAGTDEIVIGMAHRGQAQRAGACAWQALRRHPGRVPRRQPRRWCCRIWPWQHRLDRRREISPGRTARLPRERRRVDADHPRAKPQPPGVCQPGGRRARARRTRAARPARRTCPRPARVAGHCDPRRCGLPGAGRRGRDAQPLAAGRLRDRRDHPYYYQQPDRLHYRPARGPLDALRQRPGQGLRDPDRPRQRRRCCWPASPSRGWPTPIASSSARIF